MWQFPVSILIPAYDRRTNWTTGLASQDQLTTQSTRRSTTQQHQATFPTRPDEKPSLKKPYIYVLISMLTLSLMYLLTIYYFLFFTLGSPQKNGILQFYSKYETYPHLASKLFISSERGIYSPHSDISHKIIEQLLRKLYSKQTTFVIFILGPPINGILRFYSKYETYPHLASKLFISSERGTYSPHSDILHKIIEQLLRKLYSKQTTGCT